MFGARRDRARLRARSGLGWAVATKKANKQLEAEGKMPIKGNVGKRRKRVAANALLAAATKASAQPPVAVAAPPATVTNGSTPQAEPVVPATPGGPARS